MNLPRVPEEVADRVSLTDDGLALRCGETDDHYIDVVPMVFNDRIVMTNKLMPTTYDRFWCYKKGGAAILAALAWDGSDNTEPVGWIKSWDERYSNELDTM